MKKILHINIALKNNTFDKNTIVNYFNKLQGYNLLRYTFEVGQWQGQKEVTFVALLSYEYCSAAKVLSDFEKIASVMNQQCIAIKLQGLEALAYNISAKNKNTVFSNEYFYSIINEPQKPTINKNQLYEI